MIIDPQSLRRAIIREAATRMVRLFARLALRVLASLAIASIVLAAICLATFEASYVDASGSRCLAFTLGAYEADTCAAPIDRPTLGTPPVTVDADCYRGAVQACTLDASNRVDAE